MYPELLIPTDTETFDFGYSKIQIPKCVVSFDKWEGKPIRETFGGKPVVSIDNKPMFAELAIVTCFKMGGWKSRWIETYGKSKDKPMYLSEWKDNKFKNQTEDSITDKKILKMLSGIASHNNNSFSGCWDVIGWKDDEIIFAESKRTKRDKIRQTQINWLLAGLKFGLTSSNFLVVQWDIN
jgi:O-glycosyl hydrolase